MSGVQGKTVLEKTVLDKKTPEEAHGNQDERAIQASEKKARVQVSDEYEE